MESNSYFFFVAQVELVFSWVYTGFGCYLEALNISFPKENKLMKRKHIGSIPYKWLIQKAQRRTPASNQSETTTQRKSGTRVWKRDLQENGPSCHDQLLQICISKVIKQMIKVYQTIKEWCGHTKIGGCPLPQIQNSRNIYEITQPCWAEKSHRPIWNSINILTEGTCRLWIWSKRFLQRIP